MAAEVDAFLEGVSPDGRRRDAIRLLALMRDVTGVEPHLDRKMIGFGTYHYTYASGREGDAPALAFAPRKAATTIYLMDGVGAHADDLAQLGPHTTGVGCLYLKDLEAVDIGVLERILRRTWSELGSGTFTRRARDADET